MNLPLQLPALREELVVEEGPRSHNGDPSWTLYDPARSRFFRLDWLTFEIFQRWSLGNPSMIAEAVVQQTPLRVESDDVMAVLKFASANQLLNLAGANTSSALAESKTRSRPSWWLWLLHNYLFFRIPLIRPAALLEQMHRRLGFLFARGFWYTTAGAGFLGLALVWREWESFARAWGDMVSLNGIVSSLVMLVGVKVVHEFGHGLAACHYGCRVPSMGVAFLVMAPVAYTDTNEAWKLKERRPRLVIGAAGIIAELALAAWSTLAWGLLPDGSLRTTAFILASVTWIKSLVVNTSPLMRFDGYYLLSDFLDLPNLHARAFALARWRLREWLFALGERPPEFFRKTMAKGLVALAMFIWMYRLVLFLGIAIYVYQYFFKALGIVLFTVEIAWFVALPMIREVHEWVRRRRSIRKSPRLPWTGAALLLWAAIVCVPLPQRVKLSGQLSGSQEFVVTAPEAGQLAQLNLNDGQRVAKDAPLLRIESAAARLRLARNHSHEARIAAELATAQNTPHLRARVPVLKAELAAARAARRDAELANRELAPKAPFAGTLRLHSPDIRQGEHVGKGEELATLVGDGVSVVAYLDERQAHLVQEGSAARMYLDGPDGRMILLKVISIDRDASRVLAHPLLASSSGGLVDARVGDTGLVPEHSVYRVELTQIGTGTETCRQVRRGTVVIVAGSEALITRWAKNALSIVWRELGA